MIIDADCHIAPPEQGGNTITFDELLRRMDRCGVDRAITWLQPLYLRDVAPGNAYVAEAARSHPDRILGFGWAAPNLGVDSAKETVHRCVEEYGLHGVKLNGAQNSFYIDDPELSLPVIEEIADSGGMLAFHVGSDAFDRTHPFRVAKIAEMFPELPILAVHMGGVGHQDITAAMIEHAERCPNITLVGSAVRTLAIRDAIETLGAGRVCFGSDTPFELMRVAKAKYEALLEDEFSGEEREQVMGGNIARLFDVI